MKFAHKGRWIILAAAIALQLAAALSLLCYSARVRHYALAHGRIVSLACRAYDPFSPFKGRYVKLTIAESQLQGENLDRDSLDNLSGRRKKTIYCRMEEGADGLWKVAGIRREIPQDAGDDIYIEADCSFWGGDKDGFYVRAAYAFDEYYMQENFARYADSIRWDDFNALEPVLSVYVAKNGTCIQQGLTVQDGAERIAFEEYCRREVSGWNREK